MNSASTYFSLIPSGVMSNEIVSDGAKITYALILGLSNQYGYCFAPNHAIAEMRATSESSVKRHLKELLDNKLITTEYNYRNDRRIYPIVFPTTREKTLRNQNSVRYAQSSDEVNSALDQVWRKIK